MIKMFFSQYIAYGKKAILKLFMHLIIRNPLLIQIENCIIKINKEQEKV
jgi:hypothetical protein